MTAYPFSIVVDERILRRNSDVMKLLLDSVVSRQAARAGPIEGVLRDKGFLRLQGSASYMPFVPADWSETFPVMMGLQKGRVAFEVVNNFPTMAIKLLVPFLGTSFEDPLVEARRELVRRIHASGLHAAFPRAFYARRPGEERRIRPPTDKYYSVYTRSATIKDSDRPDAANSFVALTLQELRESVLPVLVPMMQASGLR